MKTSSQYREFADQCEQLVEQVKAEQHRIALKEMAEAWRNLASAADEKTAAN